MTTTFFLGANSGDGFQNLFPRLADGGNWYDLMLLKGGPGVGKSTFLRWIGAAMEEAGMTVEYLACSGDPDGLDGIVLPEQRCAALDATMPHALEPRYPAAVERIVDLGRFYDLTAAKAARERIQQHTDATYSAYERAFHALKAARQVELSAFAAARPDLRRMERRMTGILTRELHRKGMERGETAWRFLGGVTHQGTLWRFDSVETLCPKIYALNDSFGFAGAALEKFRQTASENGWDTVACVAPEEPARIEHLLVPGLGLAFVTSRTDMEFPGKIFRRVRLDGAVHIESRARLRFENRMAHLLREEAVFSLQEAKNAHDALEADYNPYVDFDGVRALAAVETGRLLSWL